jgi:uncharacterized membrane protein YeiH
MILHNVNSIEADIETLTTILDFAGVVAFAATGALVAGRHTMDVLGGLVLAFVTGIGGGTLRDVVLDVPVFWLDAPRYILACILGFALVYVAVRRFGEAPRATINTIDAIGLAVFTILGAQKTLDLGHLPAIAVIMGVLTGCGGGLLRDVLANEIPMVLSRKRLYATTSLLGAIIFVVCVPWSQAMAMGLGFCTVFILRLGAIFKNWRLPLFPEQKISKN